MSAELTEGHETKRKQFAEHCRQELINDSWYFEKIVFSDDPKYSLSEKWASKSAEYRDLTTKRSERQTP